MWFKFLFAALVPLLIKGQVPFISLTTTPVDVINGGVVCPTFVEVTCIGIEVGFLEWLRNGLSIRAFTSNSNEGTILQQGAFKLFLDSIVRSDGMTLNMTSRLVVNVSDLISSDRITCTGIGNMGTDVEDTIMLEYMLRGSPPAVPTNFSVSIESDSTTVNISITWDSAFNLVHNVTSYRVVASGGSAASCPPSCDPSSPCKCNGLGIGEDISIMISAINCGDQLGPPVMIMARPQVPSMPSGCASLPVYTLAGDLSAVNLIWTTVANPVEFLPGVSQDVTHYSVMVDIIDPMTVPASTACPTSACSYTYSLRSLSLHNSPLFVSVSAGNDIGRGVSCTPQTEIDTRNQFFSLSFDTTNTDNQTVACIQLSGVMGTTFECSFCYMYSAGVSCQNLSTCISTNASPTLLPNLTELSCCYRATASINGNPVAVIQDIFETCNPYEKFRPATHHNGAGVIAGIVIVVLFMMMTTLVLAFIIIFVLKRHGRKTKGTISTSTNRACSITDHHREVEESVYDYPQVSLENTIETKQNESISTNIVTKGNDAYGINFMYKRDL